LEIAFMDFFAIGNYPYPSGLFNSYPGREGNFWRRRRGGSGYQRRRDYWCEGTHGGRRGSNSRGVRERGTEEKIANTAKYARQ
jgi:hypothetical protein